ncbi:MAG: GAF domain-containing protein [Myxococcota bacterium]
MSDELDRKLDVVGGLREPQGLEPRLAELSRTLRSLDLDEIEGWIHDALGLPGHPAGAERTPLGWMRQQHERNAELQLRLELETLISNLSRRFLSSETAEIDDVIREGLRSVAQVASADRASLVSLPELRRDQPYFFEWCSPEFPSQASSPTEADAHQYRGFASRLLSAEVVNIPVVADMSDEQATERDAMLQAGIRSYLLVPAVSRGSLMGILCLHCIRQERHWADNEVTLLQLVADLFTSALHRKRNETALSESEARFRALAENSQDSICELCAEGRILYASPAWAQLVGTARSELEGRSLVDIAHVEDRDLLQDLVDSALCGVVDGAVSFRTRHPDGQWLDIEATARGFSTALGEPRLVAVLRDVTQRERDRRILERQISGEQRIAELSRFFMDIEPGSTQQATQDKFAVAAELAGAERAWMFTLDPQGLEEYRRYDWIPNSADAPDRRLPESSDAFAWAVSSLLQGRELSVPRVAELPPSAATERDDLLRRGVRSFLAIPLLSGQHFVGLMGFEVISRECSWSAEEMTLLRLVGEVFVSAQRREQAEIQLERSQDQLLQSQKMEAVGTLAGGIAHDFNNHLAVMLGNARFVSGEVDGDQDVCDALNDLQSSAEHCAQLTRSLLAFSRRSPVTIQVIDIFEVMAAVSDLVRPLLPSSIQLNVGAADPGHAVRADPTQLRQVLINLLVNARDAMPEGGRLELSSCERRIETQEACTRGLPSAGRYVEISVADEGEGMSEETRSRIFEPFFTTKQLGEGTGLGLATAYGIIQQCGGSISVESELAEGTTFRVLLPLSDESTHQLEPAAVLDPDSGLETLLLVEDEPAVRRLVARTLRTSGYRVFEAEDGFAALTVAEQLGDEIDLLVTDLVMPHMGGADLAAKLQAMRPELPVLLLSGHAEPRDASIEASIQDARFLQKPFEEDRLLREVRFLLDRDGRA